MYTLEESRSGYCFFKGTIDITCSLMVLSPILLSVGIARKFESKGDVMIPQYINIENFTNE